MADPKDEVLKFAGSITPMLGAGIQLGTGLAKDLRRTHRIKKEIGSPGKWFFWISHLPLLLANVILSLVIILALLSLFGGVNKYSGWTKSSFARFCEGIFDQSLWLVLCYFVLAVVVYFQIIPRLMRFIARVYGWIRPEATHDPGIINSDWEMRQADEAHIINVDRTKCEVAASFLLQLPPAKTQTEFARAFANLNWQTGSRANGLLIGCVIEGVIHDLPTGNPCKNIPWGKFYDNLEAAGEDIWKPKNLEDSNAAENIFTALKKIDPGLACLEAEPLIVDATRKTLQQLREKLLSDASNLPQSKWLKKDSFPRARKRLEQFPQMADTDRNPMKTQFLKLAYSAGVWPTINPGPFIYPFSRRVSALLINSGCLITTQDTEVITFDANFQRLTAFAEEVIVDAVIELLKGNAAIAAKPNFPDIAKPWAVTREVDTLLWFLGKQPHGWKLNLAALNQPATTGDAEVEMPPWKLSGNTLARV